MIDGLSKKVSEIRPMIAVTKLDECWVGAEEFSSLAILMEVSACSEPYDLLKIIGELGFLGVNAPTEYGGQGLSNLDAIIILEEFGKISSAVGWPVFEANAGPVKVIEHFGTEALKKRIIPDVC